MYDGVSLVLKRYAGSEHSREKLSAVYGTVFGIPVRDVFSDGTFAWVATEYQGPHAERAKYLAAALLLGAPIEFETPHDNGDGGGRTVDKPVPLPVQPSPQSAVAPWN